MEKKTKPNATKAHVHQSKETKARFDHLLQHPVWKRTGPGFGASEICHLPTYLQPRDPDGADSSVCFDICIKPKSEKRGNEHHSVAWRCSLLPEEVCFEFSVSV